MRPSVLARAAAIITAATMAVGGAAATMPARAETIAQDQAQAAALVSQIQAGQQQLDQLANEYEQGQYFAGVLDNQLRDKQNQLAATQAEAVGAGAKLRKQAVTSYLDGGVANEGMSVIMQGNATRAALGRAYLTAVTGDTQAAIANSQQVAARLRTDTARLKGAQAAVALNMARMAAERAQAQAVTNQEQATLDQVRGRLAVLVAQQQQAQAAANAARAGFSGGLAGSPTGTGAAAVAAAKTFLGVPYVWGGASRSGVDCSGLTMLAWQSAGVSLPRVTYSQWSATHPVSMSQIRPGDLVFYNGLGHVAMYVGNGQVIQALHTGTNVGYWPIGYDGPIEGVRRP